MPLWGIILILCYAVVLGSLISYVMGRRRGRKDREPEIHALKMDIIHTEQGIQKSGQETG